MLAEAALGASGFARGLDQRVLRPHGLGELRVEQPFADSETRQDELARPELVRELGEDHCGNRRACKTGRGDDLADLGVERRDDLA